MKKKLVSELNPFGKGSDPDSIGGVCVKEGVCTSKITFRRHVVMPRSQFEGGVP